jgi:hypothetical protein
MVEGVVAGFPFRGRYAPQHGSLVLSEAVLKAAGAGVGDSVTVEVTRVDDEPEARVPDDLRKALDGHAAAGALWQEITPMARREWVRWIASAKKPETREKRIAVGLDKLNNGMRRPCCFPGLNFVTKGLVEPEDTWAPLPSAKR